MRLVAAALFASLSWAACSTPGTNGSALIELGKPFSLRPGESAHTADGALRVGFTGVTGDSRCPRGEQCVVAGDARLRVWLQHGKGTRQVTELHSTSGQALPMGDHALRLVALHPDPVSGKVIAPMDYVATLALSRSESDR